jgi:hypothetical protein
VEGGIDIKSLEESKSSTYYYGRLGKKTNMAEKGE